MKRSFLLLIISYKLGCARPATRYTRFRSSVTKVFVFGKGGAERSLGPSCC